MTKEQAKAVLTMLSIEEKKKLLDFLKQLDNKIDC